MLAFYLAFLNEDDKQLFEIVYNTYRKQMLLVAQTVLNNTVDSEDAVHEVFLKIATKHMGIIKAIDNNVDLRNYLLKATKNTAINISNKKKRDNVALDTIEEYDIGGIQEFSDEDFVETICVQFEYERVVKAIQLLDDKYRNVLYYHFVMGLTISDVSKTFNQSISATKKQLVRGKKMLLKLLDN